MTWTTQYDAIQYLSFRGTSHLLKICSLMQLQADLQHSQNSIKACQNIRRISDRTVWILAGQAELEAAVRDAGRRERQLLEKRLEQLQEDLDQERQLNGQQLRYSSCL